MTKVIYTLRGQQLLGVNMLAETRECIRAEIRDGALIMQQETSDGRRRYLVVPLDLIYGVEIEEDKAPPAYTGRGENSIHGRVSSIHD